jgi:phosphorylcholine metabolism protein LicD
MSQVHKAWGICVDIFPVFPYSKDPKEQKKRQKDFRKMRLLSVKYYHIGTLNQAKGIEKMKKMVHYLVPDWLNLILFRRYFNALCKEAKLPENRCQTIYSIYMTPEQYFENEWLDSIVELEYEGQKVPCPVGYHEYLKTQYGDYMQIPKNKENHSDDPNVVVNFSECYKKYWS